MTSRNAGALLHHKMIMKHKEILEAAIRPLPGRMPDLFPDSGQNGNMRMSETRIYVGLNDAETREQIYETERYLEMLKDVCRSCHAAFSVDIEQGGYFHEDGEYTEENSLVLVLIDTDKDVVQKIAKELCALFHQESVLVTENRVDGYFINQSAVSGE